MIHIPNRPKVLLIGPCSDSTLRELADVTCLPGREYDQQRILIEQAVAEKGPFDVFGVSLLSSPPPHLARGVVIKDLCLDKWDY